jgi:hypothetical protein
MQEKKVPSRLWDYGLVYEGELLSMISRGKDGRSGHEEVTGNTADISKWLAFSFMISYGGGINRTNQM